MTDDTVQSKDAGQAVPKAMIMEMLKNKFEKLPEVDRKLLTYGSLYLGGNASLVGLIANSFYRRALNVTQGRVTSSIPMAVLPFLTTVALYNAAVTNPLLSGDLNCPTCAVTRGALVAVAGGGLYPILLALPVNAGLATRYSTAPMPETGNLWRFCVRLTEPIIKKMGFVLVLQTIFGTYLSSKHFDIFLKMLKLAEVEIEELKD
ncbi:transmembrane protein 126A [Chanos chanos]|uniref:Transmembrane protein 126A n=1 Tax=Chanos chanos TaxID=29144 RepID=A0A6J2WX03_CHACN|nr:transmembrane protein 126A [Chanos chanos]